MAYPPRVTTCTNCGAELDADATFCPRCTAPVADLDPPAESSPANSRSRAERVAFYVLSVVLAAIFVLLVLVLGFGFFVEEGA